MIYHLANPTRLLKYISNIRPWLGWLTLGLLVVGLWFALVVSPVDYQHQDAVRIMYVHVPASWFALCIYTTMALSHGIGHIWKHPVADLSAKAMAPVGLCYTILSLITGVLWAKPMWGTWWVWDARLTSMFILALFYLSYLVLIHAYDNPQRGLQAGRILCLIGIVNIPIIKGSVTWWNTLHQPASLTKLSAPSLSVEFLYPLLLMAAFYMTFWLWLSLIRLEREILSCKQHSRLLKTLNLQSQDWQGSSNYA